MAAELAAGDASARAALAGNPSDGYGGAVLAMTLPKREATVWARPASALSVVPDSELVRAAAARLAREQVPGAHRAELTWRTTIPRCVGLGGSSAIVIATLRALCSLHGTTLSRAQLAELALAVEVEDLGIAAGLQDRVAQVHGGVTFMDFSIRPPACEPVDPAALPPLVVAWRSDTAGASGAVHDSLRKRFARGEVEVVQALRELGTLARDARQALWDGDRGRFARCVDQSFEARRRMLVLDSSHVEMIDRARGVGASANYAGSGGAIVAVCESDSHRAGVVRELEALGCGTLLPG